MPSSMQRTPRSRCCLLHKLAVSDRSIIRPHVEDIWMSEHFRLGVVMDPINAIKYAKDSTLAMLLAAQARSFRSEHNQTSCRGYLDERTLSSRRRDGSHQCHQVCKGLHARDAACCTSSQFQIGA